MPSAKFHVAHKMGGHEEPFCGAFSYDNVAARYAISVGDCDIPYSNVWADSLARSFIHFDYPIENSQEFLYRFLNDARQLWIESIDWGSQRWFVRNKILGGCFSSFIGISIVKHDQFSYDVRGFSSGYVGFFWLGVDGEVVISKSASKMPVNRGFWSGYSPPLGREYHWPYSQQFFFRNRLHQKGIILLATPGIAVWLMSEADNNIMSIRNSYDPSELMRKLMKAGKLSNTDEVLAIINIP